MRKKKADLLIVNGRIVTMDEECRIIDHGMVAVTNDIITDVDENHARHLYRAEKEIDAKGCIVMPGLVNTHTHLPMSLFRGLADDMELMTWLNDHIFPAEGEHIRPDTVYAGTRLSLVELLLAGVTTVCDGYFHEDDVARAVHESGIRAVLAQGVIDYPAPGVPDPVLNIQAAREYAETWKNVSPLITPSIFCHSPYTCSGDTLKKAKDAARDHHILFQIHGAETSFEAQTIQSKHGKSPVAYMADLGILDKRTLIVHAVHVDERDIAIIAKHKAAVSHNPESNMKLASGIAPVPDMLKAGIHVGLGTDSSASNNDLDMFSEMDSTAKLHKIDRMDPTIMNAENVLKMATLGGASAIGLGHLTGSLETGKQADIIIVDMQKPHLTPMYNPLSHLVYAVKGSDVRDVLVAGREIVRNRSLLSMDLIATMDDMTTITDKISGRKP